MKDIATEAGVSSMTVSRALRNDPKISQSTKERIHQICDRLGYHPDPRLSELMIHLRRSRNKRSVETIALIKVVPERETGAPFLTEKRQIVGCYERAKQLGLRIDEFEWLPSKMSVKRMVRILRARGVRGAVLQVRGSLPEGIEEFYPYFAAANMDATIPLLHHVHTDHFQGMSLAVEKLWEKGYRRIGFYLLERVKDWAADIWKASFMYRISRYTEFEPQSICVSPVLRLDTIMPWIGTYQPEAIVSHMPAVDIMRMLIDQGIRVPEDIGVVTVEWMSRYPECAGVNQNSVNVGMSVVDVVARQLAYNEKGLPPFPKKVLVEGEWYDGLSAKNVIRNRGKKKGAAK